MPTPQDAPKFIYLEPNCEHASDERMWCEDDVWGACEECGAVVFRYRLDGPADADSAIAKLRRD